MDSTKELPQSPKSWFYIGTSRELTLKPKAFKIAGREIIAFRNEQKIAVVLQRRCSHMSADLALGCVVNNRLQCSLHRWEFDKEGFCQHISNLPSEKIPLQSNLKSYPVKERNGFVFFFNDQKALFDLPFFRNQNPDQFDSSSVQNITTENEWFVGAANAFDIVHFETVHLRHLLSPPIINQPAEYAYRIELDYEIRGKTLSDRLMKTFYGPKAKLDFTVFAGNFILAMTTVKDLKNYMMIVNEPNGRGKSRARLMVYSKKTNNPLKILKREIQAGFSRKFFQDESNSSQGVFIDNKTLSPSDQIIKTYLEWLMSISKN